MLFQLADFEFCQFQISNTKVQHKYWKDTKLDFWFFRNIAVFFSLFEIPFFMVVSIEQNESWFHQAILNLSEASKSNYNLYAYHTCWSFWTCQFHGFFKCYQYYILNLFRERFVTDLLSLLSDCWCWSSISWEPVIICCVL